MKVIENKKQGFLFTAIIILGISSVMAQVIAIREFLTVFYGNELIMGIILANWLLLTGIGSYFGKYLAKAKPSWVIISQMILAFLPLFSIIFIRNLRNLIFLQGELIGIAQIFLSSFFILLPYCLISGFLLVIACSIFSNKKEPSSIGKIYLADNIGGVIGGLLFSFLFIYFLNPFQIVFFILIINLLASLLLSFFINKKFLTGLILFLMILFSIGFFSFDLNKITRQQQYKNQKLLFQKDTPYGNLIVTKMGNQLNFYENGLTLFTTENTIANEETVHYAMPQAENTKSVLLIGGGVSGTVNEILKYNVTRIDYVELDPFIIELGKKYTKNLDTKKVKVINKDGRWFIRQTKGKYDIIIIDLPDPSTAQLNRFYTSEFFKEAKKALNKDGIISLGLSSSENYLNIETKKLNSALYNSLKDYFRNVIIIPGDKNFFIASDKELSYDIAGLIEKKGIETKYVNQFYLEGKITPDRIGYIKNSIIKNTKPNRDFSPITYYYHLLYWIGQFRFNVTLFFIIIFFLMAIYLTRLKPITFAIFTAGFAASSLEVIILIGFQILYGYAYNQISVIITAFMIGLAVGSYYMNKKLEEMTKKELVNIQYSIFFYSILLPIILIALSKTTNAFLIFISSKLILPIFTIIIAVIVGMAFPLASKLFFKGKIGETAAQIYNADLVGACVGALLVSALLIPLLGIFKVCLLIGLLNLASGLIVKHKG